MSKKWKFGRMMDTGITYLILAAVAFVFFFPCLWLILASFSKSGTIYSFNGFFPKEYSFASFQKLFTDTTLYNYPRWFFNTLFVAAGSCILGTFLVILTAYTMSRFTFTARKPMMKITMVPGGVSAGSCPRYGNCRAGGAVLNRAVRYRYLFPDRHVLKNRLFPFYPYSVSWHKYTDDILYPRQWPVQR